MGAGTLVAILLLQRVPRLPSVLIAVAGALFVAGWSAYGAELALSYGTEYRNGARDAADAAVAIAFVAIGARGVSRNR